ncbi:hypothetical protein HQ560_05970, partial [bacterium]|nr:hypothetical protein [bacterium]
VRVGLWVFGARSGHRLWLGVADGGGKVTRVQLAPVDFDGWRYLEGDVSKLTGPLALRGLMVRGGEGPLFIDDVSVTTRTECPLYLTVRQMDPQEEFVDGRAVQLHVGVQSVADERIEGTGEAVAERMGMADEPVERAKFRYRAQAGEPYERTVRLRLPTGVYRVSVRAGGAEQDMRVVVYPAKPLAVARDAESEARRFGARADAVRVYESALSPAIIVETRGRTLTLFRGLKAAGLSAPLDGLLRTIPTTRRRPEGGLAEPWMLLWFGASPKWFDVRFADGSPCPTFDAPVLIVLFERPVTAVLQGDGLEMTFASRGARVALMPFLGIARPAPGKTTRWKEKADVVHALAARCRFWASALRALPIDVEEERRINLARDEVEVRLRYRYLRTKSSWVEEERKVAPVPPLLSLARRAGMKVVYSKDPRSTGCQTSVGPYYIVPDTDTFSYTIYGLLRYVNRAVSDLPGEGDAPFVLSPGGRSAAAGNGRIPRWAQQGEPGRAFAEGMARYVLWQGNAHYAQSPSQGPVAMDGLSWQTQGETEARAAAAEQLRTAWYASRWADVREPLAARARHLAALAEAVRPEGDWATLGVGTTYLPFDARLNGALFHARVAARLGDGASYGAACGRFVKLLAAGWALVGNAPAYAEQHGPWFGLVGQGKDVVFGRCLPGSVGLASGAPPFVSSPSDAGYAFAGEHVRDYLRERFSRGQDGFYGRDLPAWAERTFVELDAPAVDRDFHPVAPLVGDFASNYVATVETGEDGWPRIAWHSHRSPKGGPLVLCGMG